MSVDLVKVVKKQQKMIGELQAEIEELKRKGKVIVKDDKYSFTKNTVNFISKKKGEAEQKLSKHQAILVEIYLAATDVPFREKAILKKVSDIEYLIPEVKNIAHNIRGKK